MVEEDITIGYTCKDEFVPEDEIDKLKGVVLELLADGDPKTEKRNRQTATDNIANIITEYGHVNTTRDDVKPEIWVYSGGVYIPQGKTYILELCRKVLGRAFTTQFANLVISKVMTDTYVDADVFFNHNIIEEIVVQNGILNILTQELSDFTPDKIFFAKLPVTYNNIKKCPKIRQHFETVLKNPTCDVPAMFELFGYCLYKENKFEKAFMFSGEGSNGKSKTFEIVKCFIGPENNSSETLQKLNGEPYSAAHLHRKMTNIGGDIPDKPLKESEMFKGLTGRDNVSAQRKFLTNLYFKNYAKILFGANQIPRPSEDTDAFWRRWLIFEFPYKFVSKEIYYKTKDSERINLRICDPDIVNKLTTKDELSGLLNESLDSLQKLLSKKVFTNEKSNEEVRKFWIKKSDSFKAYTMNYLEESVCGVISKKELQQKYIEYCHKNKLRLVSTKSIKYTLEQTFGCLDRRIIVNNEQTYCWEGISFKKKERVEF